MGEGQGLRHRGLCEATACSHSSGLCPPCTASDGPGWAERDQIRNPRQCYSRRPGANLTGAGDHSQCPYGHNLEVHLLMPRLSMGHMPSGDKGPSSSPI